jgi:hypothetical protein
MKLMLAMTPTALASKTVPIADVIISRRRLVEINFE